MIREVEVNNRHYQIDTTPICTSSRRPYPHIERFEEVPTSGVVVGALNDLLGRVTMTRIWFTVGWEEEIELAQTLGWDFSRSRAWKNLWELGRSSFRRLL